MTSKRRVLLVAEICLLSLALFSCSAEGGRRKRRQDEVAPDTVDDVAEVAADVAADAVEEGIADEAADTGVVDEDAADDAVEEAAAEVEETIKRRASKKKRRFMSAWKHPYASKKKKRKRAARSAFTGRQPRPGRTRNNPLKYGFSPSYIGSAGYYTKNSKSDDDTDYYYYGPYLSQFYEEGQVDPYDYLENGMYDRR